MKKKHITKAKVMLSKEISQTKAKAKIRVLQEVGLIILDWNYDQKTQIISIELHGEVRVLDLFKWFPDLEKNIHSIKTEIFQKIGEDSLK